MKLRKLLGMLIMMCMLIGMLPTTALAGETTCLGYTGFYVETEDRTVVDGAKVAVVLYNTEDDEIVVAESTDGKVDIDANEMYHNETETAIVYHGNEYAYLRVEFDLPDGYAYYTGENEFVDVFEAKDLNISAGYMYIIDDLSIKEFKVYSEKDEVVDGTLIKVVLHNTDEDKVVIAESTTGKAEYSVVYNEEKNVLIYNDMEYTYLTIEIDLPENYENYNGDNTYSITYDAENGYTDTYYYVEDMSDGDSRLEESIHSELVIDNQYYAVYKFYKYGELDYTSVKLDFKDIDLDEDIILEALSYVTKEDKPKVTIGVKEEKLPELPAKVMDTLSELGASLEYASYNLYQGVVQGVGIEQVSSDEAFSFELKKNNSQSIIDKLIVSGIENGYVQYEILGTGQQENLTTFGILETGTFTIPEVDETSDIQFADKHIYYYDIEKDVFVLASDAKAIYMEMEDQAALQIEINQRGTYVVSDKALPESLTTPKEDTPADIPADIPTDIVTDEVVEEDVLEEVKEQEGSLNIKVEESDKSSFVNWAFDKIEYVMDFLPTVHVDVQIDEVNKCVEDVKVTADFKYTTVSFDFDGGLPGKAEVTLDIQNSNLGKEDVTEGQIVYLYYFNPDRKDFEYIDESAIKEGFATFTMTHCSDYIVTTELLPENVNVPDTGDDSTFMMYGLVLLLGIGCVFMARKRNLI
ncbi:MAG: hypothetical protein IJE49_11815 [Agathobacter sp.]|nr:hypothetical protein [Agathobacter sp.]